MIYERRFPLASFSGVMRIWAQAKASHAHKPAYELPLKVPDALRPRGYIVRKVIDLFGSANGDRTRTLSLERAAC